MDKTEWAKDMMDKTGEERGIETKTREEKKCLKMVELEEI